MVIWGIVWGLIIGAMLPGMYDLGWIPGAIVGALLGLTLRYSVRNEIDRRIKDANAKSLAQSALIASEAATNINGSRAQTAEAQLAALREKTPEVANGVASATQATTDSTVTEMALAAQGKPSLTATVTPELTKSEAPLAAAKPPPTKSSAPAKPPTPNILETAFTAALKWLTGGNTVVRAGVVVLFIGLSFLAKYAAENSMFPVELRLALVGAAGLALLITGFRLRDKRRGYAMTLQGAGVAVLYLTVFASFKLYALLPAGLALAIMVAVCALSTAIALLQNSRTLAVIGFAGGFLAPVLASTGGGSHVVLFSYYLLLNLAILFIAFKRSWRILNLVGFIFTFGVATFWGSLRYAPEHYATTQPFLIAFFLVYVAAAILYAQREVTQLKATANGAVDATLVFGNPIVSFGLQAALVQHIEFAMAFSALALGAFYLLLASVLLKRSKDHQRLLIECFLALGVGFATLAVPLALDARWTAAVWAVEGAAVFWVGMRQARWMPRLFGLLLQGVAALSFMSTADRGGSALYPFANPMFVGAMMLALPAFAIAWWARRPIAHSGSRFATAYAQAERNLPTPFFLIGFAWWLLALWMEISRYVVSVASANDAASAFNFVINPAMHANLMMLAFVVSALVAQWFSQRKQWDVAAWPAYVTAPVLALTAFTNLINDDRLLNHFGWIFWLIALALHFILLRRIDHKPPRPWFTAMHALGVWVVVVLLADVLVYAVNKGDLWRTAWASVVLLISATLVLLALAMYATSKRASTRWPFLSFARSYVWYAAMPLAVIVFFGALIVALTSSGRADPLPYIPLLNPTDISIALAFAAIFLWLQRLRVLGTGVPQALLGNAPKIALAAAAFIAINTVWLRVAHHFAGVSWNADALFGSFVVQTGYAILWTVLALVLMVFAHRRVMRTLWMVGAGLLALTVAKLFLVDLSNAGGTERIVAFIVVGVLMLIVGYLAPLPPAVSTKTASKATEDTATVEAGTP
jgi:uncharacterized membrane protein